MCKMWHDLGLCLYQEVYYRLSYYNPWQLALIFFEVTALDVWTELLDKCICFQPVAPACIQA